MTVGPRAAYFDAVGNGARVFVPPRLAQDIADTYGICRGPGGDLWWNDGGIYRPGAADIVREQVRRTLGDEFRQNRLNEVLAWCGTLPVGVSTDPPSENVINVANGVLDVETWELRPVDPTDRFTYRLPVAWAPDAQCPAVREFVDDVLPADSLTLASEILGMCVLPTARYRRAVMLLGSGSNGKSVFLGLVRALLGDENVSSVTLHALGEDRFAKAELFGKLANIAGDLDARPLERTDTFKMLTGNDPITADRKYGQPFTFTSYATLLFSANEWPVSYDQSDAYFTRWIALPFLSHYREDGGPLAPGERRADPRLLDRLTTPSELEGLLCAAVRGARRLRERGGFEVPASVRSAVADYRSWADTIIAWADDAVTSKADGLLTRKTVYDGYRTWCRDNGRSPVSSKKFWPRFREIVAERGVNIGDARLGDARAVSGLRVEGAVI